MLPLTLTLSAAVLPLQASAEDICPQIPGISGGIINLPTTLTGANSNVRSCFIERGIVLTNSNGATLTNTTTGDLHTTGGSLVNYGTVLNDGALYASIKPPSFDPHPPVENRGTFVNHAGGVVKINSNATFTNIGTLNNYGAVNNLYFQSSVALNRGILFNTSTGTVNNFGQLYNSAKTTIYNDGKLVNQSTGTLDNRGSLKTTLRLNNFGAVSNTGTIDNTAALYNASSLNSPGNINNKANGKLINGNSGTLTNSGALTNQSGAKAYNFGTLNNSSTLINNSGASLANNGNLNNTGTFTNAGTLNTYGTSVITNSGSLSNSGTLLNNNGGQISNSNTFNNAGSFVTNGPVVGSGTFTQTDGTTETSGGSITQSLISIEGGALSGAGPLNGAVLNSGGVVEVGSSGGPATLTIQGGYTQEAGGDLRIRFNGTGPGQFSLLSVTSSIALDGALDIVTGNGFNFAADQLFTIATFAVGGINLTGHFAKINADGHVGDGTSVDIGNNLNLTLHYNSNAGSLQLQVRSVAAPVPLPAASLFMLSALVPLLERARARKKNSPA